MNTFSNPIRIAVVGALTSATGVMLGHDPAAPAKDPTAWNVKAGANLALTAGNSETFLVGADILAVKKWNKNELFLGADGAYGNNKDEGEDRSTTVQNYGGVMQYNRLFTDRWYGYFNFSGRQDRIADIDYRFILSPGAGYYFVKNEQTQLSGEAGPGLIFEKLGGVSSAYWTVRFAEHFRHKFNSRASLFQNAEYLPRVDEWSDYIINADIGIETLITDHFGLRVYFQDNYNSHPAQGKKNNDLRLMAGLTYTF